MNTKSCNLLTTVDYVVFENNKVLRIPSYTEEKCSNRPPNSNILVQIKNSQNVIFNLVRLLNLHLKFCISLK